MNTQEKITAPGSVKNISTTRNAVETAIGRAKSRSHNSRWDIRNSTKDKNIPKWPDR